MATPDKSLWDRTQKHSVNLKFDAKMIETFEAWVKLQGRGDERIDEALSLLKWLVLQGDKLMASVQELKDDLAGLKSDIATEHIEVQQNAAAAKAAHDALMLKIAELEAVIAGGGVATQADLDEMKAAVAEARNGVTAISEAIGSEPPPVEPPPAGG